MKKVLFIDRDGTLVIEPESNFQIDSWEKLEFFPGALFWLPMIAKEEQFELVIVTNQDGLGTSGYPLSIFAPIQERIIKTFEGVGVVFKKVHIDSSFKHENKPTRKPGIGMLSEYFNGDYDLKNSFVIGDRFTDVLLAKNIGCKCIWMNEEGKLSEKDENITIELAKDAIALQTTNWQNIYEFLKMQPRIASVKRKTNETNIAVTINLDGKGIAEINTGINFFNHMLEQIAKHSQSDLVIAVEGDLHIDEHHTIEDTAIAFGEALKIAIGDKKGIERYGFCLPMDDCEAKVSMDFSGRPWLVWNAEFKREKIGDFPTEMFFHFFKSLSDSATINLNIEATGQNEHHKIESIFKAFARALKSAKKVDYNNLTLPSTKGKL